MEKEPKSNTHNPLGEEKESGSVRLDVAVSIMQHRQRQSQENKSVHLLQVITPMKYYRGTNIHKTHIMTFNHLLDSEEKMKSEDISFSNPKQKNADSKVWWEGLMARERES